MNILVFAVRFSVVEVGFRFATDSQQSSRYQIIELFRRSRPDGPGDRRDVDVSLISDGLRVTTGQPEDFSGRVLIFGGSTTFVAKLKTVKLIRQCSNKNLLPLV